MTWAPPPPAMLVGIIWEARYRSLWLTAKWTYNDCALTGIVGRQKLDNLTASICILNHQAALLLLLLLTLLRLRINESEKKHLLFSRIFCKFAKASVFEQIISPFARRFQLSPAWWSAARFHWMSFLFGWVVINRIKWRCRSRRFCFMNKLTAFC